MKRHVTNGRKNAKRLCKRDDDVKCSTSKGLFSSLPEEINQLLLSKYISPKSLVTFVGTSKTMCSYVQHLTIETKLFIQPILPWIEAKNYKNIKCRFQDIGVLLRSTSAHLTLTERLIVIETFLCELEEIYHKMCESISLRFAYDCIGVFLYKIISDWDESSMSQAFALIDRLSRLKERVKKVMVGKPGTFKMNERDVRQFVHEVFFNKSKSKDQNMFWLSKILEMYPINHCRLIYLLFGPEQSLSNNDTVDIVDWDRMRCCSAHHTSCTDISFAGLVDVFTDIMESDRFSWSAQFVIQFFGNLTCTPEPWCLENSAKLMYLMGKEFTVKILKSKITLGRVQEFSHVIYHLAQVSAERSEQAPPHNLQWLVSILYEALAPQSTTKRNSILTEVFNSWIENMNSLTDELDNPAEQDEIREDLRSSYTCIAGMGQLLFSLMLSDKPGNPMTFSPLYHHEH